MIVELREASGRIVHGRQKAPVEQAIADMNNARDLGQLREARLRLEALRGVKPEQTAAVPADTQQARMQEAFQRAYGMSERDAAVAAGGRYGHPVVAAQKGREPDAFDRLAEAMHEGPAFARAMREGRPCQKLLE
jgi:hypothetical protein